MSHTKGEWVVRNEQNNGLFVALGDGDAIAKVFKENRTVTPKEAEANAKLIASAPELLVAVKVALWDLENGEAEAQKQGKPRLSERAEIFRNAIKNATA